MNFDLGSDQQAIFDMARGFGQDAIAPNAAAWEEAGTIPRNLWTEVAALGLGGIFVGESFGGAALPRLDGTLIFEALAMACPSVGSFLSIHNMCGGMIDRFGTPANKADWLPALCRMETVFSYCLTEPDSGSDAAALTTRAERVAGGWRLNGVKAFISGGGYSDAYLVMARTGGSGARGISAFIVQAGTPGLSFGAQERKMGWKAQPTAQVQFDDCIVPEGNLLGDEGAAFPMPWPALDGGRLNIAAGALGGAQEALDRTLAYMGQRKAFGQTLDRFQALQFRLADLETALQSARVFLCGMAAWKLDQALPTPPSSAPWPSCRSRMPPSTWPTSACSCMAATAISRTSASRRSCAICVSTRSSKAPTRSCA